MSSNMNEITEKQLLKSGFKSFTKGDLACSPDLLMQGRSKGSHDYKGSVKIITSLWTLEQQGTTVYV